MGRITEAKKLSIEHCKKILNSSGKEYTDEEVRKIREILYILGELDYIIFKQIQKDNEKGNSVC